MVVGVEDWYEFNPSDEAHCLTCGVLVTRVLIERDTTLAEWENPRHWVLGDLTTIFPCGHSEGWLSPIERGDPLQPRETTWVDETHRFEFPAGTRYADAVEEMVAVLSPEQAATIAAHLFRQVTGGLELETIEDLAAEERLRAIDDEFGWKDSQEVNWSEIKED